jgi:hypothetical protein
MSPRYWTAARAGDASGSSDRRPAALHHGPERNADHRPRRWHWKPHGFDHSQARAGTGSEGLVYRPVGRRGEPYPDWLQQIKGASGVYIVRLDGETVYVGESHSDRLYETLTRHFQEWRRWKGFWRGQYGEGHDPGLTYPRARAEVAVKVTPPSHAIAEEARLIRRLRPRDNLTGVPRTDDPPF